MIAAKKLTRGKDVTPKDDIAEDEEGVLALEKATRKQRKSYSLFEGTETSLNASALTLIQRDGYTWRTVNGWNFWMFENETVAERLNNILEEQSELID